MVVFLFSRALLPSFCWLTSKVCCPSTRSAAGSLVPAFNAATG